MSTGRFVVGFGSKRLLTRNRRVPGFPVPNHHNLYPLQFHGEHLPNWSSRVSLSRQADSLGRLKLDIRLRFSQADVEGVASAHEYWDASFRAQGIGRIEHLYPN